MTNPHDIIHKVCDELGCYAPKVVTYHNATLVVIRNGDGHRVADLLEPDIQEPAIRQRLAQLYKVKAENQPSRETMDRMNLSLPSGTRGEAATYGFPDDAKIIVTASGYRLTTPEEIRAFQEGKKAAQS